MIKKRLKDFVFIDPKRIKQALKLDKQPIRLQDVESIEKKDSVDDLEKNMLLILTRRQKDK